MDLSDRHLHSLSSNTEQPRRPQIALYRVQPSPQLNSPPPTAMRRSKCSGGQTPSFDPGTCVPTAYLDSGVDPNSVDFRNFFAYIPNEVKHRKRTTRDQAKVLETVFDRNTKPDSILRQRLATELGMSARGVQVSVVSLVMGLKLPFVLLLTFLGGFLGAVRYGFRIGKSLASLVLSCVIVVN